MRSARRHPFVLGRQGLWPGRRWQGLRGTETAMRTMEHLQLAPLAIIARPKELMLEPGGRLRRRRLGGADLRAAAFLRVGWLAGGAADGQAAALPGRDAARPRRLASDRVRRGARRRDREMREVLRTGARSATATSRTTSASGSPLPGPQDSARAPLPGRFGEAMVTRRERFERVYARTARVAPRSLIRESDEATADEKLLRKEVAFDGLTRFSGLNGLLRRPIARDELAAWRDRRVEDGTLLEVHVEGWTGPRWALGSDAATLATLARGRVPRAWRPIDPRPTRRRCSSRRSTRSAPAAGRSRCSASTTPGRSTRPPRSDAMATTCCRCVG